MDISKLKKLDDYRWQIDPFGNMNVPAIIFGDQTLLEAMDEKVYDQSCNVARLPGIVKASYAMPDAHWGYGFPIGGVAAFDPDKGGVISAGGVGFDISCGVRTLLTGLTVDDIEPVAKQLAAQLARDIPAGVGSTGMINLSEYQTDEMLTGGAEWAVDNGYGLRADLERIEENGKITEADPRTVSQAAKSRIKNQIGTLGSGNHYLEIQKVTRIDNPEIAQIFQLKENDILISIHCGSRGLGHQIGTDYLAKMIRAARESGIDLPEKELACAPIDSQVGRQYYTAMNAGINCAFANRQVLTDLARKAFERIIPKSDIRPLYDVSHNTCKKERHKINGQEKTLFVHRKGATRAFGPEDQAVPAQIRKGGQPVIIGGTMGTSSYILAGTQQGRSVAFGSSCHGAGRVMSRTAAKKQWKGPDIISQLKQKNIIIKGASTKGIAEEAPGAYKDVEIVAEVSEKANLAKRVAKLEPMICVKG